MTHSYKILLDDIEIGTTEFEKADAPMGVVLGIIKFAQDHYGYAFFKNYCLSHNIEIAEDHPEDKLISTMSIQNLRIINSAGAEVNGLGNQIMGMDSEEFELSVYGIPYPFFEEEFPHHVQEYRKKFD